LENIEKCDVQAYNQGSTVYIGKYPRREEKYQPLSFRGNNMKRGREKGGKCRTKRIKANRAQ
jgi:hypothetical protein